MATARHIILEDSWYYDHLARESGGIIYLVVLILVSAGLLALPFVKINVSIKSPGVFQTAVTRLPLLSPGTGNVRDIRMRENQFVQRGDTLLVFDSSLTEAKSHSDQDRLRLLSLLSADARTILSDLQNPDLKRSVLRSGRYRSIFDEFQAQSERLRTVLQSSERRLTRYKYLMQGNAITLAEYEQVALEHEQASLDLRTFITQFDSRLEADIASFVEESRQIASRLDDSRHAIRNSVLLASVSGTIQDLSGLAQGSFVTLGSKIADISPQGPIVAEVFVRPSDAALLKPRQNATLQIMAMGSSHRSSLPATVSEISEDITLINNEPVIRVRCMIRESSLHRAGTDRQLVRKGVTFIASLHLAKRTLFQLLSDQIENWIANDQI